MEIKLHDDVSVCKAIPYRPPSTGKMHELFNQEKTVLRKGSVPQNGSNRRGRFARLQAVMTVLDASVSQRNLAISDNTAPEVLPACRCVGLIKWPLVKRPFGIF
ncbi:MULTISPECIES: hypothetical protein [unclassified Phyllobacterium]|uniref:hypothetical protein n=1 Tax=unclassified Phyllobacterium TaxID=2638441 RepID=UPI0030131673